MKYIVSGGGTGGHIYPALSIIEKLKEYDKDASILYIGKENSLEENLVKKAGIDFRGITISGLPRRLSMSTFKTGLNLIQGLQDAKNIIKDFNPDAIIGTGGYVSFPVVYIGQRRKINTYIQEQNAFPGKANKLLAKKATKVFIAFDDAKNRLDSPSIIKTGNPIDEKFSKLNKDESRQVFNLGEDKLVLSFGGSGGQESINDALIGIFKENNNPPFKIIHITGKNHYESFIKQLEDEKIDLGENIEILDYSHDMPLLMSASDLVIMSSSAISLAEIHSLDKAAILIPKSYTADNHQVYNGKSYIKNNNAKLILEEDLNSKDLYQDIREMLGKNHKEEPKENKSAQIIAEEILRDLRVEI